MSVNTDRIEPAPGYGGMSLTASDRYQTTTLLWAPLGRGTSRANPHVHAAWGQRDTVGLTGGVEVERHASALFGVARGRRVRRGDRRDDCHWLVVGSDRPAPG